MSWTPKVQNIGGVFITSGGQTETKWTPNSDQINDPFYTQGSGAAPEVTLDGVTTIQFDKVILLPTGSQPRVVNTGTPNHAVLTLYLPLTSGEAGNSAPIASENIAGLIRVGRSLKIDDEAVLEVNTADRVEKDNTLPITSQAVNEKIQGIAKALSEDVATKAPTNHASNENTYGTGNANAYGHVKLSASTSDTAGADDGIAATPSAVKSAYDLANNAMLGLDGLRESLDERLDQAGVVPTNHASSDTTYGKGDGTSYGHVKLSASTSSTSGVSDGIAATPSAVKSAYDLANNATLGLDGLRESLNERLDQTDDNVDVLTNMVAEMVPTNHASSGTDYGKGDGTSYGHVKLSASTSSTSGVSDGIAATPSAVKSAYDLANNATLGLDGLRQSLGERLDQTDDNVDVLTNLVEEHVIDTNNPHNVTVAQIGAAPGGYGLGGANSWLGVNANVDDLSAIGWYSYGSDNITPNKPFDYGDIFCFMNRQGTYPRKMQLANNAVSDYPELKIRKMENGAWSEWEWVNPPMVPGVEYRTTKRWNRKPVYTKLIEFVNSSAISGTSSVYIPHGISNLDFMLKAEVTTSGYFLPYVDSDTSLVISAWTGTNLVAYNGRSSWSANRTWYVTTEYTKK